MASSQTASVGQHSAATVTWLDKNGQPAAPPQSVAWSASDANATVTPDASNENAADVAAVAVDPGVSIEAIATLADGTQITAAPATFIVAAGVAASGTVDLGPPV
jgi:hypothetical protein